MTRFSRPMALLALIASSVLFTIALAAFCFALGLDFTNEGWSRSGASTPVSQVKTGWMIGSMIGFMVSIVLCFAGLHRISRPDG